MQHLLKQAYISASVMVVLTLNFLPKTASCQRQVELGKQTDLPLPLTLTIFSLYLAYHHLYILSAKLWQALKRDLPST